MDNLTETDADEDVITKGMTNKSIPLVYYYYKMSINTLSKHGRCA